MSCFSTFEAYSKFKLTSMKLNKDNNRGKPLATRKQVPFGSQKLSSVFSLHHRLGLYSFAKQNKEESLSAGTIGKLSAAFLILINKGTVKLENILPLIT